MSDFWDEVKSGKKKVNRLIEDKVADTQGDPDSWRTRIRNGLAAGLQSINDVGTPESSTDAALLVAPAVAGKGLSALRAARAAGEGESVFRGLMDSADAARAAGGGAESAAAVTGEGTEKIREVSQLQKQLEQLGKPLAGESKGERVAREAERRSVQSRLSALDEELSPADASFRD